MYTFTNILLDPCAPGPRPEPLVPLLMAPLFIVLGRKDWISPPNGPVADFFKTLPAMRGETITKVRLEPCTPSVNDSFVARCSETTQAFFSYRNCPPRERGSSNVRLFDLGAPCMYSCITVMSLCLSD